MLLVIALLAIPFSTLGGIGSVSAVSAPTTAETVGTVLTTVFTGPYVRNSAVGSDYRIYDSTANAFNADLSSMWASSAGAVEFDFYVSESQTLKTAMSSGAIFQLMIVGRDNSVLNAEAFFSADKIKNDGWNHIVLSKNSFSGKTTSWTNVGRIVFGFYTWSGANPAAVFPGDSCKSLTYALANIQGTEITRRTESTVGDKIANQLPAVIKTGSLGSVSSTYRGQLKDSEGVYAQRVVNGSTTNPSACQYLEFDFYVDNYDALMSALDTLGGGLYFYVSSHASNPLSNYRKYNLAKQLTHDGWNHIVLVYGGVDTANAAAPCAVASPSGGSVFGYTARFEDCGSTLNIAAYDFFAMTDVIATTKVIPNDTAVGGVANVITTEGKTATLPSNFQGTGSNFTMIGLPASDISTANNLEFDFFVESYGVLKKEMAAQGPADLAITVSSNATTPTNNRILSNFWSQVHQSGWNHIVIPRSEWNTASVTQTAIVSFTIYFRGTINVANNTARMKLTVANLCGTMNAAFKSHSLVLGEKIGINFFMDLSELSAAQKAGSYMTFAVTNSDTQLRTDFDSEFVSANGAYYGFTCLLSSVQMAEQVTPTFHYATGETATGAPFAVKDYIDYVVANSSSFPSSVVDLVQALGDYGHYMQIYLGYKNGWSAGTDYTVLAKYRATDYTAGDYTAKLAELNTGEVAMVKEIDGSVVTNVRYNLNFDSSTYINIVLTANEPVIASATVDGVTIYASESGTFRTQGLPILQLGDTITLNGTGSTDLTPFSVSLSGLSYIRAILKTNDNSQGAKDAMSALYDYYRAARIYRDITTGGGNNSALNGETVED